MILLMVTDKRQITVLLSCTMDGKLLPTQVIYAGKTPACLPKGDIPTDWYLTYSENHWENEHTCNDGVFA